MAEFSADSSPKAMPARFSPRTGNLGAQAAKPRGTPGRKPGLGRPHPQQGQDQQQSIGRPEPGEPDPNQPQDLSYLDLLMQHFNMKGLGRDVPYVVWASMTGNYRQHTEAGRPPFDIFEDG